MIGIFDSGVGGLSIYRSVKALFPSEGVVYLADQKNFPYGGKTQKKLEEIAVKNTRFLIEKGAKVVIVACNTATVHTISLLRKKFKIPFIGVVPAVKPAYKCSKNKKIGVLATKGTVNSQYLQDLLNEFCAEGKTFLANGSRLVEAIEKCEKSAKRSFLNGTMKYFLENEVDTIVLGCTHYYFVLEEFKKIAPNMIFVGSEEAIAAQLKRVLAKHGLKIKVSEDEFYTTGKEAMLKDFLKNNLKLSTNKIYGI